MTKKAVKRRVMEKLAKLQVYNEQARKTWGKEIAAEMFMTDLDFFSTVLYLIDNPIPEETSDRPPTT